ncbi:MULTISPECIES: glycosyltransferase family 4 protein [unclassified Coleofasciculus]|uniref:glycosyltransferase family 4 protein n=1 Tax=unclassified Coleofasciculus TaxID=2692782 RepID=UPI001882637F|nr:MULTISPECIES: glycosyltransferase family 4 protein [unclassified Coleofasciculus]MBE9126154.1 glycosyltransferase [Coleofasciculus sp. LEGE 07081]MBE9149572.1 glycosyltransferase [Coleofasciculus sp. LEGE 07092]
MSLASENYLRLHNGSAFYKKRDSNRMNVLMLAPHPFYQNRGTPIAVNLVLKVLSKRGDQVDVVTYPEGQDIHYENVNIYRIPRLPFIRKIRPGFSWKKIICDIFMFFKVIHLVATKHYDLVHAGEEAVFIGLFLKVFLKIPYVYDMDSSLAQQMVEKYPNLKFLVLLLEFFEGIAVKNAKVVVAVCDALAVDVQKYKPRNVVVIPDISLLNPN